MALSAQVLPPELKTQVIARLEQMKTEILDYPLVKEHKLLETVTLQQIQDNINFLQARCMYDTHWQDCIEFNHNLDHSRNQMSFVVVNPEFADYV
jgi:hypothetical protein